MLCGYITHELVIYVRGCTGQILEGNGQILEGNGQILEGTGHFGYCRPVWAEPRVPGTVVHIFSK